MTKWALALASAMLLNCQLTWADGPCPVVLKDLTLTEKVQAFRAEVSSVGPIRLVLKDSPPVDPPSKWHGLATYYVPELKTGWSRYLQSILQFIPRQFGRRFLGGENYRLTPVKAAYDNAIRNPVRDFTKKTKGRQKEPTRLVVAPLMLAFSFLAYAEVDAAYTKSLSSHVQSQVAQFASEYDHSIQSDYRYNKIKEDLQAKRITVEQARNEAYLVTLAYTQYYKYRDSHFENRNLKSELKLLDHYLFASLKNVVNQGVKPAEGFYVPEASLGPISDEQKMQLFEVNHLLYLKYQLISEMLAGKLNNVSDKPTNPITALKGQIENDPFDQTLKSLYDQKKISKDQYQASLQENAYWQTKFSEWEIIGVIKLKMVDGKYSDVPLTLTDIQREMLKSLASQRSTD